MANVMRHRYGDSKLVMATPASADVIEIGDLVGVDTTLKSVEDTDWWTANEADAQEAFHDGFLGVAMSGSAAGETADVAVATAGVFEMIAESDTYLFGQMVGPYDVGATGTNLGSQAVEDVATGNLAIGRVSKIEAAASTSVYVEIQSTLLNGGPQEMV